MGKVVMSMSVSLDGMFEGPGGDLSWHRVPDELHDWFNEVLGAAGADVNGRRSWELMSDYWPEADQDASLPRPQHEYAAIWRRTPKVVFSRTLTEVGWGARLEREVTPAVVEDLRATYDGDLWIGGPDLARSFVAHGLLDELWLYVVPVVLGAGRRLFDELGGPPSLDLVETRTFPEDVVLLRYARSRSASTS